MPHSTSTGRPLAPHPGDLASPVITDDLRAASRRLLDAGHQSAKPVCASSNVTFFLNYSGFGAPTPSHT